MKTELYIGSWVILLLLIGGSACTSRDAVAPEDTTPENSSSSQWEPRVSSLHLDAPPETYHFGQFVGSWSIQDETLQADGSWLEGEEAEWIWYYILDGFAIQDDWIAPARHLPAGENGRQYGTNLRIYNPQTDAWELAWLSNTGKTVDVYDATGTAEEVIMTRTLPNGRGQRITFFDITPSSFEWKMEVEQPDTTWQEVYRIHATRTS